LECISSPGMDMATPHGSNAKPPWKLRPLE
jgi:hypothetical protein